jgi:8-amino-7-oxononanoate synthase
MRDEEAAAELTHAGRAEKRSLASELESHLRELDERGQLRTLEVPAGINLISNDYLGLSAHPALHRAVIEAVERAERMGSGGSRLLAGHACEWDELEAEFAEFAGTEAALYFTSGYAANVGLLSSVLRRGDVVFSDALNHASLIDGIRLSGAEKVVYPHCDVQALESALRGRETNTGRKLIVMESVFSMDGDLAPLAEIAVLAQRYGAELMADEAHATGVFGPQGRGCMAQMGLERKAFAIVHTCGKALASAGAFVCGSAALKNYLINCARTFLFSTALPPYFAAQIRAALGVAREMDAERAALAVLAEDLRALLRARGWNTGASASHIVPVFIGENEAATRLAAQLGACGFAVRAIRPPTVPAGSARLRLSLTCALKEEELVRLVSAMRPARSANVDQVGAHAASAGA